MQYMKNELSLNKAYGEFVLGVSVDDYLQKRHTKLIYEEKTYTNECYVFEDDGIEVWCNDGVINTIRCEINCFYNGFNLIGMKYDDFLSYFQWQPSSEDVIYLLNNGRGQNQHVYEFGEEGLQIWVWRKKIRTIQIYSAQV